MKKSLLFACIAGMVFSAGAQNRTTKNVVNIRNINRHSINSQPVSNNTPIAPAQRKNPLVITNTGINNIVLGWSANAFGGYTRPARSICYADPNLNAVVVTHRAAPACVPADGAPSSGCIMFDYSKTGGTSWNPAPSLGSVFVSGSELARYPNGVIYNPTGNTNPDNAYIAVYGPCTGPAIATGASWMAIANGAAQLGSPTTTVSQHTDWYDSTVNFVGVIPDAMVITQQGVAWTIDLRVDGTTAYTYTDSLIVRKGTWNATTKIFDYSTSIVYFPVIAGNIGETAIAFAPNGQTGYITAIANTDLSVAADTSNFLVVLKTTDGGNSWSAPINIPVAAPAGTALGGSGSYSPAFDLDASVDLNGNLYMHTSIFPYLTNGNISITPGVWGQFAVYTEDGGTTWKFHLLDKPSTMEMTTTGSQALTENTRGQISTNWACNKMVFTWFDTDTSAFSGGQNSNPNALAMGYDVASKFWGPVKNLTEGSLSDGEVTFGDVSYYLLPGSSANSYKIPISYQTISGGDESACTRWHYIDGAELTVAPDGINEIANNVFSVSNIFPNPSSGVSTIEVKMKKADNISMEVSNLIGQVVFSTNASLGTGTHKFTIDASKWDSGVYFYTVKSKDFNVTSKLIRE